MSGVITTSKARKFVAKAAGEILGVPTLPKTTESQPQLHFPMDELC